jgi:hypothetical protein
MKKTIFLTAITLAFTAALPAQARNVKYLMSLDTALQAPEVKGRVDGSIKLYFGAQAHPEVATKITTDEITTKGVIESKNDMAACYNALGDGIKQLQEMARNAGADAIINIVSYYKRGNITNSDTVVECHAGSGSAGLSLRGDIVKFAK